MKLVTGIEAIQSGKRFRYVPIYSELRPTEWMSIESGFVKTITPAHILESRWEIEQKPREFWVHPERLIIYTDDALRADDNPKTHGWIKVREVME